ncbi:response regulator transcription factor [Streptomyces sp. NPDC046909]|uniref:response regulator transcription factor n=1 Tax=Streptomyces sp. NPDC046909 TaxID=3155617 RepID=UPI003404C0E1
MDERHATLHVLPTAQALTRAWADEPDPAPATTTAGAPVRVHVVGADPLARTGIRTLLEGHPGIRVTGESGPGPEAATALRSRRPHVLVAHGPLAADRARELTRAAGDGVRLLTMGDAAPGAPGMPGSGGLAHGHLPATATAGQLASAVVLAAAGYTFVHETARSVHRATAAASARESGESRGSQGSQVSQVSRVSPDQLTDRECEVLELLARGLSNGEIAAQLSLSEHTVKTHVQNLLHKLRLRNRVHAAIYAFETGLRHPC